MISPQPVFLHPLDFWKTNLNQLQLQQLASSNIATTSSPASAGGGGGEGSGNNHHQDGLMAAAAGGAGGVEGEGGGWGTNMPNMPLLSMSERARLARVPRQEEGLKCPRCDSTNTKFRYFNNYSLSEPRHFCRACRRYWTRGGALRDRNVGPTRVQPPRQAKRTTRPRTPPKIRMAKHRQWNKTSN